MSDLIRDNGPLPQNIAAGMIPALTVGWVAYRATDTISQGIGARFEQSSGDLLDKIDRFLFERYGDVQAFAANPLARGTQAQRTEAANFYTRTYGIYDLMVIADADGRITAVNTVDQTVQYEPVQGRPLEVRVDDRGVERAIRKLRRLLASEGVLREIKRRRHYEKPSVKSKRKLREAERRRKRRERKRTENR